MGISAIAGALSAFYAPLLVGWGARFLVNATIGAIGGLWSPILNGNPFDPVDFVGSTVGGGVGGAVSGAGGVSGAVGGGTGQGFARAVVEGGVIEAIVDFITDLFSGNQNGGAMGPWSPTAGAPNLFTPPTSLRGSPRVLSAGYLR